MQRDHVLKKLLHSWFPLICYATSPWILAYWPQDRGGGLRAKYLLQRCCIRDSLYFDMQHDHVLKKLNLDLLIPYRRVLGLGVCVQNICCHVAEFMIPFNLICNMTMFWNSCCIGDSLKFDMQHDHVLKKWILTYWPNPLGRGGGRCLRAKYLLQCCCIRDSL